MKICPMPFLALEARTNGEVSVCCTMQETATREDGTPFNLNRDSIRDVLESDWLRRLRRDFLCGKGSEACSHCWTQEKIGAVSKRERELRQWEHYLPRIEQGESPAYPVFLDLKLGNLCNLKCRICGGHSSSTWIKEELAAYPPGEREKSYSFKMKEWGEWPKKGNFWSDLEDMLPFMEKIEFYGGEPLLIQEHFRILEKIVEKGFAARISLSYSTNGFLLPPAAMRVWENFKEVCLQFSIDGIGKKFTYLRYPAPWNEVRGNLDLCSRNPRLLTGICATVSAYNIFDIGEVLDFHQEHYPHLFLYLNYLYTPAHLSCKIFPEKVKRKIREHLLRGPYKRHRERIMPLLDYMEVEDQSIHFPQFLEAMAASDAYRNESYSQTFPRFWKILKEIDL